MFSVALANQDLFWVLNLPYFPTANYQCKQNIDTCICQSHPQNRGHTHSIRLIWGEMFFVLLNSKGQLIKVWMGCSRTLRHSTETWKGEGEAPGTWKRTWLKSRREFCVIFLWRRRCWKEQGPVRNTGNFRGDWEGASGINSITFLFSLVSTGAPHCPNQTRSLQIQESCWCDHIGQPSRAEWERAENRSGRRNRMYSAQNLNQKLGTMRR